MTDLIKNDIEKIERALNIRLDEWNCSTDQTSSLFTIVSSNTFN